MDIKNIIIYEDKDIFVCHKPAGMLSQSDRGFSMDLVSALLNYERKKGIKQPFVAPVNRLDRPVEGLVLLAKNSQSAAALTKQITSHNVDKCYYAIVEYKNGMHSGCNSVDGDGTNCTSNIKKNNDNNIEINNKNIDNEEIKQNNNEIKEETKSVTQVSVLLKDYLLKDAKTNTSSVVCKETKGAKLAELEYCMLNVKDNKALLKVKLHTGRHHQIRVQLANAGMPIIGDTKYNKNLPDTDENKKNSSQELRADRYNSSYKKQPLSHSIALCSYLLEFTHPVTGKKMKFEITPKGEMFSGNHFFIE